MSDYWLVLDETEGDYMAVVECYDGKAEVIAGKGAALQMFQDGEPKYERDLFWNVEWLTKHSCCPFMREWVVDIGPVTYTKEQLQEKLEQGDYYPPVEVAA
jgi:hypothetical protein